MASNFDLAVRRPYLGKDGRTYITRYTVNDNGERVPQAIVQNAPIAQGLLRKNDWLTIDMAVLKAAKPRLRAVADLRSAGLEYTIPDGMAKVILQHERQSDITPATLSMSGLRKSEEDRPMFDLNNLPLPIAHKDFSYDLRQLMASRTGGSPLDTTTAELAGRRVAEVIEQLYLGTTTAYNFGGGSVFGLTNFPDRITGNLTQKPFVASAANTAWNPLVTLNDVLAMKTQSQQTALHYGPWILYCGLAWDQYMDADYINIQGVGGTNVSTGTAMTLRDRLRRIDNLIDVRTLDYFPQGTAANPAFDLVLVQQTSDVVRLVVGMDITTIQWETEGGMDLHFKVLCILVPQLRSDINSNSGIIHFS